MLIANLSKALISEMLFETFKRVFQHSLSRKELENLLNFFKIFRKYGIRFQICRSYRF